MAVSYKDIKKRQIFKVCRFLFYILEAVLFEPLNKRDFISIVISCISVKV